MTMEWIKRKYEDYRIKRLIKNMIIFLQKPDLDYHIEFKKYFVEFINLKRKHNDYKYDHDLTKILVHICFQENLDEGLFRFLYEDDDRVYKYSAIRKLILSKGYNFIDFHNYTLINNTIFNKKFILNKLCKSDAYNLFCVRQCHNNYYIKKTNKIIECIKNKRKKYYRILFKKIVYSQYLLKIYDEVRFRPGNSGFLMCLKEFNELKK